MIVNVKLNLLMRNAKFWVNIFVNKSELLDELFP